MHLRDKKLIQPGEMINKFSLAEHLEFANAYFAGREGHHYLYQKPFYHPRDCAPSLSNLGQLFAGLQLDAGMRVLEFAAGSCWLSRLLVQMGGVVTSCDASATALEIGKELFRRHPPIADHFTEPEFQVFNGERLESADGHYDRVIVNDAFHHIPNVEAVLAEFFRVLNDGGIVAMSEPGRFHSRTDASQFEMATFNVIENDFVLEDIWAIAQRVGFEHIAICPVLRHPTMSMDEYLQCIRGEVPLPVVDGLVQGTVNHSIFFLYKRSPTPTQMSRPLVEVVENREEFNEAFYFERYPDVATAIRRGDFVDGWQHYERHGRDEGRMARP